MRLGAIHFTCARGAMALERKAVAKEWKLVFWSCDGCRIGEGCSSLVEVGGMREVIALIKVFQAKIASSSSFTTENCSSGVIVSWLKVNLPESHICSHFSRISDNGAQSSAFGYDELTVSTIVPSDCFPCLESWVPSITLQGVPKYLPKAGRKPKSQGLWQDHR